MNRVILTKGLPASGKTTWAKELLKKEPGNWKRINKDDLRAMMDNGKWTKDNEKHILETRDSLILLALSNNYNVIIDDTNLHSKHKNHISHLTAEYATVEVKDFTDISVDECIKRDKTRQNYVGEKVIRDMYNRFLRPTPIPQAWNVELPSSIICDLDGTLALFGDNNPYERDFTKDKLNMSIATILAGAKPRHIILLSERMEKFRDQTEIWLSKNGILYHDLFMRKTDDVRKDVIIKEELYNEHIRDKYNVLFVLDDRNQVVEFWRSIGLTCLQVADGDF